MSSELLNGSVKYDSSGWTPFINRVTSLRSGYQMFSFKASLWLSEVTFWFLKTVLIGFDSSNGFQAPRPKATAFQEERLIRHFGNFDGFRLNFPQRKAGKNQKNSLCFRNLSLPKCGIVFWKETLLSKGFKKFFCLPAFPAVVRDPVEISQSKTGDKFMNRLLERLLDPVTVCDR